MKSIVVVGSINMDIVATTDQYPVHGDTVLGHSMQMFSGGKGANQATACAKLGKQVQLIGAVGRDAFGQEVIRTLTENNVDISLLTYTESQATGCALVTIDKTAENTMLVIKGANDELREEDIIGKFKDVEAGSVLLIQMEIPSKTILQAVKLAKEKEMFVILDPAPAAGVTIEALQYADVITPNAQETYELTGIKIDSIESAYKAGVYFDHQLGVSNSIIKLGSKGALVYQKGKTFFVDPIPVQAVDTVGAGDSFAGALACAVAEGEALESAAQFAAVVAAMKVTKPGAQKGLPTLEEVTAFCQERGLNGYRTQLQ
ncbi:ribokinase [Domibacillus sp. DTU_2020_1001157_1_SI_ALB_TIR_016]|uniref:ribokinase n=1 Tax=Domibacillus sp. DTU_2020_1001157_1_SI_ALB_TIR_016 TaxID=3077789 RepID=UPI0028E63474|nr:ribokinase [Domibacillus sp. DTU_2020_1001157_1_SI_ALB_TIR_016]WNS79072.1 ribokinase [Domibacillus sp. DTU_2020_1001157_1_SI_ALB_TIR_016]